MWQAFFGNLKTTLAGILSGITTGAITFTIAPGSDLKHVGTAVVAGIIGALPGILAKDHNVTGGTKAQ